MPVILSKSSEAQWIDLTIAEDDALKLLQPPPSEILKAHTISPLINSRSEDRNTPEVIKPYNYPSGNMLF
jgi:putative SOS response-associated peptidase YedK